MKEANPPPIPDPIEITTFSMSASSIKLPNCGSMSDYPSITYHTNFKSSHGFLPDLYNMRLLDKVLIKLVQTKNPPLAPICLIWRALH